MRPPTNRGNGHGKPAPAPTPTPTPPPTNGLWVPTFQTIPLLANAPEGFSFDMPAYPAHVGYITRGIVGPIAEYIKATVELVATSGTPEYSFQTESFNTCPTPPANMRVFIERAGDRMINDPAYADYRWWADLAFGFVLATTRMDLYVPLKPENFKNVLGATGVEHLNGFQAALANVSAVGVTFGGGCFDGHGVFVKNGTARFTLSGFDAR